MTLAAGSLAYSLLARAFRRKETLRNAPYFGKVNEEGTRLLMPQP